MTFRWLFNDLSMTVDDVLMFLMTFCWIVDDLLMTRWWLFWWLVHDLLMAFWWLVDSWWLLMTCWWIAGDFWKTPLIVDAFWEWHSDVFLLTFYFMIRVGSVEGMPDITLPGLRIFKITKHLQSGVVNRSSAGNTPSPKSKGVPPTGSSRKQHRS